jgi:LacI family transcriptional regulator
VPNRAAQLLRSNRSYTIGVVSNGIVSDSYGGRIVLGLQQVVQPAAHMSMVIDTTDDLEPSDWGVANLIASGVVGIVYAAPSPKALHRSPRLDNTRTVFVNCWPDRGRAEAIILADEYHGGLAAARAAFEFGHRDVAFLGGYEDEYACVERRRGFLDAARAAGVDPDGLVQRYGNYMIDSGYDLTVQLLTEHAPTAIVCGNDRMAIGALLALNSSGLECPADISLIGFDDQPEMASQVRPALTTVALPHLEMGRRAGELLLGEPSETPANITVSCELIRRNSLSPPRATRPQRRARR